MAVVIDGTSGISSPDYEVDGVTGQIYPIVRGTAVTASGTSVDFTGIPSWARRITVMLSGVSTNGTSVPLIQIGAGSITTSGYVGGGWTSNTSNSNSTTGFITGGAFNGSFTKHGIATITTLGSNLWLCSYAGGWGGTSGTGDAAGGSITLSGTLDRVRITTVNGTDTFDAGTINILYE
jgi:hypothetical protein